MTCTSSKKGKFCVAAAVLTGLTLAQAAPFVSASPAVGRLVVKEAPAPTAEEVALSSVNRQRPEKNMGKINIADDIISDVIRRSQKKDSAEVVRVKTQLAEAIEAANDQYFDKAVTILKHLNKEHPESRSIQKWLAIYQNWAGQYEDSEETLESLRSSYTLSREALDNDFMTAFYSVDNHRHLGYDVAKEIEALKALSEKQYSLPLESIDYAVLTKSLASYQEFMFKSHNGATLTHADSKSLDELWRMIPKQKQAHLDNYYGYNIDKLTPVYASFYNRKDLTNAYEQRQDKLRKHIVETEIKEKKAESPEAPQPFNEIAVQGEEGVGGNPDGDSAGAVISGLAED